MPDYQVGNLQIVFEAVDETASAFDKLSKNLSAIKNVVFNINKIDSTSIKKFGENLEQIRVQFTPFLADIKNVGEELIALSNIIKTAGGKPEKMTETANAIADISKNLSTTTQTNEESKETIIEGTNAIIAGANRAKKNTQDLVIQQQKAAIEAKQHELALLKANYAMGNLNITSKEYAQQVDNLESEIKRLSGAVDEVDKPVKKTTNSWKKFLNQIKRVAIYRLIRTLLKAVVSTFRDTINAFAQVDDGVNEAMSSLTSSLNVIKLSIGTSILPLLQMIEPIVSQIAVAFANLGNMISATFAKEGKFTKINTEYIEDYRKQIEKTQGSLLDFDKFRVLNQQQGQLSDFLIPDQNAKDYLQQIGFNEFAFKGIADAVSGISKLISEIFETIEKIGSSYVFRTVVGVITEVVGGLFDAAGWLLDILNNSYLIEPILAGILGYFILIKAEAIKTAATKVIGWFQNIQLQGALAATTLQKVQVGFQYLGAAIITAFASFALFNTIINQFEGDGKRVVSIIAIVVGALTTLLGVILAIKGGLKGGLAGAIVAGIGVGALLAGIKGLSNQAVSDTNSISLRANGGLPDKGTMFVAGEAGAEMVYNMPSGQSGVANISQIQQAMYNALVQYGRENRGEDTPININIDGQKVFEATRRTAGRRGLGFGNI